jgi:sarcosine oxidase subunit alpha
MTQPFRTAAGTLINRRREIGFSFNGRSYAGYEGDTLASALLANGVRIVGRSFKYHRPRGVFGLGAEEPNALVQQGTGARSEPNSKATQVELVDGLVATSQNCWPSVDFDLGAIANVLSPLLPAGFYYKTFMGPPAGWRTYEPFIRHMGGMGRCSREPDPDRYEHSHAHCEVLVVGAGPAGLSAALAAARSGARVLLVDDGPRLGGSLLSTCDRIDDEPALDWVERSTLELTAFPEVRVLTRATAFGYYDHNLIGILERVTDHRPALPGEPRQRVWHVRTQQVVLATGAHERSMVFGNNDLPGVMLTTAVRGYVNRFGVCAGRKAVIFTNNDSAYEAVPELRDSGIDIRALIDCRPRPSPRMAALLEAALVELVSGSAVVRANGRRGVRSVAVARIDEDGFAESRPRTIACDLLCVSGGWNPTIHLHAQARGRPLYDGGISAFVPGAPVQAERSAGAANGLFSLVECINDGAAAGSNAAKAAGFPLRELAKAAPARTSPHGQIGIVWRDRRTGSRNVKRFVDLQNDVTDADIELAVREGYRSVEHVKRYTTLGMGTDQGKTSNPTGFALIAAALNTDISMVGTTTYRPPFVPVALGALAGAEGGRHFRPRRRTPMHDCHLAAGAMMLETGPWLRPQCYPQAGEDLGMAARREAISVRRGVGLVDVSTLGKLEVIGPDAAEFLERIYINRWTNLQVGRCRYGVMLREDGLVFDDGTTTRLDDARFFMTTTTAQAQLVARRLTYWHRVLWPNLKLRIVDVTEQWAAVALAGPASREVLLQATGDCDLGHIALPHMGMTTGTIAGIDARVFRISFSGDLAFEIYVPALHGAALWNRLLDIGSRWEIAPYGIDALNTLRIEKGHVAGAELNGRVTADDLGLGRMIRSKGDFIGRRSLSRPGLAEPDRWQLTGFVPQDGTTELPPGAKIIGNETGRYIGELTSNTWSPTLEMPIALGLLSAGRARHGQQLVASSPLAGRNVPVIARSPIFFDPKGERLRA